MTSTPVTAAAAAAGTGEAPSRLVVDGTIVVLPDSERCRGRKVTVIARYRVERVVRGVRRWPRGRPLLVAHRCPRRPRGFSSRARGNAGRMRPGNRHRLHVQLLPTGSPKRWVDPFDNDLPRYAALRTDRAQRRPRLVVTVEGGGGTYHRISFERPSVTVGSRLDADVLLADGDVAPLHLRLTPKGDKTALVRLGGAVVLINGKPLARGAARHVLSYKDRVTVGPYTLRVSLLTAKWLERHGQ